MSKSLAFFIEEFAPTVRTTHFSAQIFVANFLFTMEAFVVSHISVLMTVFSTVYARPVN